MEKGGEAQTALDAKDWDHNCYTNLYLYYDSAVLSNFDINNMNLLKGLLGWENRIKTAEGITYPMPKYNWKHGNQTNEN